MVFKYHAVFSVRFNNWSRHWITLKHLLFARGSSGVVQFRSSVPVEFYGYSALGVKEPTRLRSPYQVISCSRIFRHQDVARGCGDGVVTSLCEHRLVIETRRDRGSGRDAGAKKQLLGVYRAMYDVPRRSVYVPRPPNVQPPPSTLKRQCARAPEVGAR